MRSAAYRTLPFSPFLNTCISFTLLVVASGSLAIAQSTLQFIQEPPLLIGAAEAFAAHVEVLDGNGDPDGGFSPNLVVTLAGGASGLSGTTSKKVGSDGVARFEDLRVAGGGIYRLVVTGGPARPDTSRAFTVLGIAADELEFHTQPSNTQAGVAMATVEVWAVVSPGVADPTFSGDITIAIGSNPGGGTLSGTTTATATAGRATFDGLSINRTGSGYTLVASASGLPNRTSAAFNITPGPASGATSLLSANPTSIAANGSSTSTITVQLRDSLDNPLTTGGATVTLSTTAGALSGVTDNGNGTYTASLTSATTPGSATVSGTVNGSSIDDTAVVMFTGPGPASGATSLISASPTSIPADGSSTSTITVELRDASGTPLTSGGDNVLLSTTAGTLGSVSDNGNGTYTATLTASTTGGSATISGTVNGGAITDTAVVTFTGPGPPSGATSQITASPTSIPANGTATSTITVELRDASGTPLTTGGATVALSTTAGALSGVTDNGNGTYTATLTAPSSAGSATVSGTVNASAISDTAVVTFTEVPTRLEFVQQPTDEVAGAPITPAVTVRAVNSGGQTVPGFTGNVTIGIGTNPSGGTLSGTTTVAAVNGIATFGNLSINRTGSGYTLAASSGTLTGATSASFAITPGPPSAATTQITAAPTSIPANGTAQSTITVQLRDALGNDLTSGSAVVALNRAPSSGNLGAVVNNGNGTYTATLTAPSSTTTTTVTITGTLNSQPIADNAQVTFTGVAPVATRLVFGQQPTNEQAGTTITPAVTVRAVDASGATITSFTGNVTLAIGTNPAGGTLSGTTTVAAVAGVATFSTLRIEQAGNGYTLTASASGLTGATSAAFSITPGPASAAASRITASPASVPADGTSTSTITVELRDAFGNRLTSGGDVVTLATTAGSMGPVSDIGNGTYTAELTSPITPTTATVSGRVNAAAISDTAEVTFTFVPPTTFRLEFGQQPTNTQAGRPISPAVTVRAVDNTGALQTSFTGVVTIALGVNPANGILTGATSAAAIGGIATFSNLSIDRVAVGYRLSAGASGFSGATSLPFAVTPAPASGTTTTITAQPTALPADGASTSTVTVQVRDALGNLREAGGDQVVLSTTAGTLSTVTDLTNGTYTATLTAPSAAATATISGTVNGAPIADTAVVVFGSVSPAPVALAFGQQPGTTQVGAAISPAVTVRAVDGGGATATSFTGTVTIALGASPGGGTLSGTTTATAVAGVATFSNLRISQAGAGYTLTASAAGLTGATSAPFTVTSAPVTADLSVTASVDDASPAVGDTVRYTIRVTNTSGERVTGVEVEYELDERLAFVSSVPTAGSYNPQTEVWSVGTLEAGAGATLEIAARVVR
jgi:adhesin/invasin